MNSYGHPHPEVLERAADIDAAVFLPDELVTIQVITVANRCGGHQALRGRIASSHWLPSHFNSLYSIIKIGEPFDSQLFRIDERYNMDALTIPLFNDDLAKLKEMADRHGITPEALARVSSEELLARPEEEFQRVVDFALEKNAGLYRRLA